MKKNFSLSLPRPCTEKWNDFTVVSHGRLCGSCSKVVVDFTKMSDGEIIEYFNLENADRTCGRFRPDQLKMYSGKDSVVVKPGQFLFKAGLAAVLVLMSGRQVFSQSAMPTTRIEVTERSYAQIKDRSPSPDSRMIEGIITSAEDKSPLPGVNVMLKGYSDGTVTDVNGKFRFPGLLKNGDVLVFSFIGLKTQEITISKNTTSVIELTMGMDFVGMLGGVSYKAHGKKPSVIRRAWNKVKGLF